VPGTPAGGPAASAAAGPRPGTLTDLPESATEQDGSVVLRVLSWNLRSLRDDRAALVRVVRACRPDVLLAQEAPRFLRWRKAAARLARECGMVVVTGGAPATGPLILTTLRAHVERAEDVLLPPTPGLHRRGLATAVVRAGGARFALVSAHLSLEPAERLAQAGLLRDRVTALAEPYALVGADLNETPDGPVAARLAAPGPGALADAFEAKPWGAAETYAARRPVKRIDAVLTTPGVDVLGCGVPRGLPGVAEADLRAASDHLPVLAALRVPPVR
jgi:endonuclease/exonuclease/phosphatase family metal-dependent hydrolase